MGCLPGGPRPNNVAEGLNQPGSTRVKTGTRNMLRPLMPSLKCLPEVDRSMSAPSKQRRIRKAVFPVAGFGTRVLPATKSIPKEMLTLVDQPVLQVVVDEAREAGSSISSSSQAATSR